MNPSRRPLIEHENEIWPTMLVKTEKYIKLYLVFANAIFTACLIVLGTFSNFASERVLSTE